ncbi:MAG: hypothetical protein J5714_02850 [Alphaproteobacteria bacterium]|nr:hypothetical protein [Alphaproteobacteria bacterium]
MLRRMGIFAVSMLAVVVAAVADTAQNPRALSTQADTKSDTRVLSRTATMGALTRRAIGETRARTGATTRLARATSSGGTRVVTDLAHVSVARSATAQKSNPRGGARSVTNSVAGLSRAATTARATAVFNDLGKIGSGYAACRESYATCMDQMCANANDTYRRCFCSDRFTKFRSVEESLDEAMIMLQQFQDNNLEVIDKTAAEVNAMYSASIGEAAIKKDTSASAKLLDNINKLLSGGGTSSTASNMNNSIGILDLDFSVDFDDVWSDGGFSLFDTGNQDLSTLEGTALFNAAQRQCTRLTQNMCENNAAFTMSRSSYNILISQDCNTYEKALNKKKETVAQAVRTAEKYLREARLEEYRAHNSMDVNECLAKVRSAMLSDTACGENYKRCLDPTGAYIDSTGEPIYSPRLFQLEKTIKLPGVTDNNINTDILGANSAYEKFLDGYRGYVTQQLDTCRSIADFVWTEFKRNAVIEIAQAQANKIEEVKSSCVDTIAECYDAQSQSIIKLGSKKTATTAGALGRYTARDMCQEKVSACAALYSRGTGCTFDSNGYLQNSTACGMESLITYVNTVDDLMVVEKCKDAVDEYLTELCTPDDGKYEYPYNCKGLTTQRIRELITGYVESYCKNPTMSDSDWSNSPLKTQLDAYATLAIDDIQADIKAVLADICEDLDGYWYDNLQGETLLKQFYTKVYGGNEDTTWGYCYQNSERIACENYNVGHADDPLTEWYNGQCTFFDAWYEMKCKELDGYYEGGTCYVPNE